MLYLLKSARVREYHQQNVALMAAAEGDEIDIAYSLRWVQDGLEPQEEDGCVIVFSDSPFTDFVPVRFGVLRHVGMREERLYLRVELGPLVRPGGRDVLTERWRARTDEGRPGKVFVFTDENPGLLSPRSLTEVDEAWRTTIDALGSNGFYERSTFARVLRVEDSGGDVIEFERVVPVGEELRAVVELRSPHEQPGPVSVVGEARPSGSAQVQRVDSASTATVEVPVRLAAPGPCSVTLRILPEPLRSSRPLLFLSAAASESGDAVPLSLGAAAGTTVPAATEVAALTARLERDATLDDAAWVGLFEDVFLRWSPDDPVLLQSYAQHCFAHGDYDKTIAALGRIDNRTPEGDHLLLLASLRSGRPAPYAELVERIDFNAEGPFVELLDAAAQATEDVGMTLFALLPHRLLGDEKSLRLLERARDRIHTPDAVCQLASLIVYGDSEAAADVLLEAWPNPNGMPDQAVDLLLQFGRRVSRLAPYVRAYVDRLGAAGLWGSLDKVVAQLSVLPERDRYEIGGRAGQLMVGAEVNDVRERGFELLLRMIETARRLSDLDTAVALAWSLSAAAPQLDATFQALATETMASVRADIERSDVFAEYQKAKEHARDNRLFAACQGKVIHLVGGKKEDWVSEVKAVTGAAEVRWHETEKAKRPTIDWADGLRHDRDYVVVIIDRISHAASGAVKERCAAGGVLHVPSRLSRRAVLDDLDAALLAR